MTREAEYWDADTVGLLSLGRSDGTLKRGWSERHGSHSMIMAMCLGWRSLRMEVH